MSSPLKLVLLSTAVLLGTLSLGAQPPRGGPGGGPGAAPGRLSPHETVSAAIGGFNGPRVTITYGRPLSRNPNPPGEIRKIFGALVPWDQADRMGADEATTLITQKPLVFGSTTIPAGTYTLYWVLSEKGDSKLAFSRNVGKWGIPVDETADVARVTLRKTELPAQLDQLTIAVENTPTGGVIKISWEKTQYAAEFTVKE
jgi:uncharacterized protein (DUF2141 family)